jgi:sulfite reductase (NADPH) hemoprotein beta-component
MAAQTKRVPLPAILLANDLLDGDVVFAFADGAGGLTWTRDPALAMVAADDAAADRLEAFAAAELRGNKVVDAYLVDVAIESGSPVPRHFRERFKTLGPSNRPDLGKQAGEGIASAPKG